jgi:hypothetical protein
MGMYMEVISTFLGLSESELLLYGGIAIMIVAAISTVIDIAVFILSGWKLRNRLEQEYGNIQKDK